MENREYVAAVDLGTTKVVIAVARRAEKNKVEICAIKEISSQGVIKGDIKNSEQASRAIKDVKARIEAELGVTLKEVYIGISGQHIKCSRANGYVFVENSDKEVSEVKESDVKRLRDSMRNTPITLGQSIITVLPQSYTLDDESDISEPVGMEGRRLEAKFNLIVGEDAAIERIRRSFSRVGLAVAGIVLQPLASSDAVLSEDEKELGVAVVDIGGGTTDLCIYHDKIIRHIAVIPIGGNIINKDIKAYGILERHVEKLKVSFGEAIAERAQAEKYINIPSVSGQAPKEIAVKALAGIIEARMEDIIDYVASEIDKCGYRGKLGAGIVLTGGGATLKNLDILFRTKLGCDVRVANPTIHLTPESVEMVANPKYSTIAGLLIDAVRTGKFTEVSQREVEEIVAPAQPVAAITATPKPRTQSLQADHTQYPQNSPYDYYPPEKASANSASSQPQEYYDANEAQNEQYIAGQDTYEYDEQNAGVQQEEEEIVAVTKKGGGVFGRFKKMFNNMFVEEVDDEESY